MTTTTHFGWVPVGEQLPESERWVLAFFRYDNGIGRTIRAMYVGPNTLEANESWDECTYDEGQGVYFCPEGWYEANEYEETHWRVAETVTHWMPLPSPPEMEPST